MGYLVTSRIINLIPEMLTNKEDYLAMVNRIILAKIKLDNLECFIISRITIGRIIKARL